MDDHDAFDAQSFFSRGSRFGVAAEYVRRIRSCVCTTSDDGFGEWSLSLHCAGLVHPTFSFFSFLFGLMRESAYECGSFVSFFLNAPLRWSTSKMSEYRTSHHFGRRAKCPCVSGSKCSPRSSYTHQERVSVYPKQKALSLFGPHCLLVPRTVLLYHFRDMAT